jgi:hypothetical protein
VHSLEQVKKEQNRKNQKVKTKTQQMSFGVKAFNLLNQVKASVKSAVSSTPAVAATTTTSAVPEHICDACHKAIEGDICTLLGGERGAKPRQLCRACLNAAAMFGALVEARLLEIGSMQFIVTEHNGAICQLCVESDIVPAIKFIETNCDVDGDTVGTSCWLCAKCMLAKAKLNKDAKVTSLPTPVVVTVAVTTPPPPAAPVPSSSVVSSVRTTTTAEVDPLETVSTTPTVDWSILEIDDDDDDDNGGGGVDDDDAGNIPIAEPISAPPEPGDENVENDVLLMKPTAEWMSILKRAGIEPSMLRDPAVMHALMASFEETGIHVSRQEIDALSIAAATKPVPMPPSAPQAVVPPPTPPPVPPPVPRERPVAMKITPSNRKALSVDNDMLGAIRSKQLRSVQIATLDRAPHCDPGTLARALQAAILKRRPALVSTLRNAGTLIEWGDETDTVPTAPNKTTSAPAEARPTTAAAAPAEPQFFTMRTMRGVSTLKRKKLCERCGERKAAARVTLPNVEKQVRACAQCVVELQKENPGPDPDPDDKQ